MTRQSVDRTKRRRPSAPEGCFGGVELQEFVDGIGRKIEGAPRTKEHRNRDRGPLLLPREVRGATTEPGEHGHQGQRVVFEEDDLHARIDAML